MSRLSWDEIGSKIFETGIDRGVLYPAVGAGVPWVGLISVAEEATGGDIEKLYFDGSKFLDVVASEDFDATLTAFQYPKEFAPSNGMKSLVPGLMVTQQPRSTFGPSYRTLIGNDILGPGFAYKLHLVYGCTAAPSGRTNQTMSDSPSADPMEWKISTVPPPASTYKPTAHFIIDSRTMDPGTLADLESYLYGRPGANPRLPSQDEVIELLSNDITEPLTGTI